jgi:hypothetical protein
MATTTPVLGLLKPVVGADDDLWGGFWNHNADVLDAQVVTRGSGVAIVGTDPTSTVYEPLWWDSNSGQLFIQYNDGTSIQWVSANSIDASTLEGSFLPLTGGTVTGPTVFTGGTNADRAFLLAHHSVNAVAAPAGQIASWYAFNVDNDSADTSAAQGGGAHATYFGSTISTGAVGGRTGLSVYQGQLGATTVVDGQYYVAFGAFNEAYHSAGGTPPAPKGALFASNVGATIKTGAGNWLTCVGTEIDVGVETGNTVAFKTGLGIVQFATDAIQGSLDDAGIAFLNQMGGSAPGWKTGIQFGGYTGWWPFRSSSTLIGTKASNTSGGPAMTANWGLDLLAVTFSGGLIRGPGFSVNGSGNVSAAAGSFSGRVTAPGGLDFGAVAPASANDLSRSLAFDGSHGFNMFGTALNYNAYAAHVFYINGASVGYIAGSGLNSMPIGQASPVIGTFSTVQVNSTSGPTWTGGSAAPASAQPVGSIYSRIGGAVGATLYVSRGGGTWNPVAGV